MTRRRIFIVSIVVCVLVGVPVGTVVVGVLRGDRSLILARDIAGMPFIVYAFISAGPFAAIAGVIGGAVLLALLGTERWNPKWYGWVLTCAGCGLLAAVAVIGAMSLVSLAQGSGLAPLSMFTVGGLAGAFCGAVLGLYGWKLKRTGSTESLR